MASASLVPTLSLLCYTSANTSLTCLTNWPCMVKSPPPPHTVCRYLVSVCVLTMMWLMSGASAVRCYRFWRQVPGHLRCVESNSLGLVWGIGWDGTAWVYSGRCGQQPIPGKPAHKFKITFRNRLTLQNMWTSFTENTKHLMAFNVRQKGKFLPDFLYKLV